MNIETNNFTNIYNKILQISSEKLSRIHLYIARYKVKHACSTPRSGSSSSNSILSRALSSMTRLCSDRATLRLDQSFAFDANPFIVACVYIYHSWPLSYVYLCHFFSSSSLPLSHRSKDVAPHGHTSTLHPFRIEFNFLFFYPSLRSSIHAPFNASNIDNVAINIAITIACLHRFLWPV